MPRLRTVQKVSELDVIERQLTHKIPTIKSDLNRLLDEEGLSLRETVHTLSELMHYSDDDRIRLDAVKTTLNLHGVGKGAEEEKVQINILITDGEVNPITLARPER